MDLNPLFEMQRVLDERIIDDKGLEGQDLIPNSILASIVELAECANEWRGFKHWSNDQEPRAELLEEFVDKLHFLLSIGLQFGFSQHVSKINIYKELDITTQFLSLFHATTLLNRFRELSQYTLTLGMFFGLGEMLGFTWGQIEEAYIDKNKINHQRQSNGY